MAHLEVKPRSRSNWWLWLIIIIIVVVAAFFLWNKYGGGRILAAHSDTTKTVADSTKKAK
jgi:hypothetical protein